MAINLHSDYTLLGLRKPGEQGYKIPRGGMFEYVSGANYLGECLEWAGFALAGWSLPALAFAVFTFSNIAPRGYKHHLCGAPLRVIGMGVPPHFVRVRLPTRFFLFLVFAGGISKSLKTTPRTARRSSPLSGDFGVY